MNSEKNIDYLFYENFRESFRTTVRTTVAPLWCCFGIVDIIYQPNLAPKWIVIRILVVLSWFFGYPVLSTNFGRKYHYIVTTFLASLSTITVNYFTITAGDSYCSPYTIGILLCLVSGQLVLALPKSYFTLLSIISLAPATIYYAVQNSWLTFWVLIGVGGVLIFLTRHSLITPDGMLKKAALLNFQISNLKLKLENEYKEKTRIAKINASAQSITETAQFLAHDLKKPFSMLQILTNQIANGTISIEKAKAYSKYLNETNKYVTTLIEDLLLVGGQFELNLTKTNLKSLALESINFCKNTSNRNIQTEIDVEADMTINIDPKYFKRVFTNIFFNALEATKNKEKIKISVKSFMRNKSTVIELWNSGSYLTPSQCEEIFFKFKTTEQANGGTGLGLSICHEIIKRHGGCISCKSEKGLGVCFMIEL